MRPANGKPLVGSRKKECGGRGRKDRKNASAIEEGHQGHALEALSIGLPMRERAGGFELCAHKHRVDGTAWLFGSSLRTAPQCAPRL